MKRWLFALICLALALGVSGCMLGNAGSENAERISQKLSAKYGGEFSFVANRNDVWSSKSSSAVFVDTDGTRFTVRISAQGYYDNYAAFVFDPQTNDWLSGELDADGKVFTSTKSFFSGENAQYELLKEYLEDCSMVKILFCTTNTTLDFDELTACLQNVARENGFPMTADIYILTEQAYAEVSGYDAEISVAKIVRHRCVCINVDGTIALTRED